MATAKKLPSGSYRVRVYSHTDGTGRKVKPEDINFVLEMIKRTSNNDD